MTASEAFKHFKVAAHETLMQHPGQVGPKGGVLYKVVSNRALAAHRRAKWETVTKPKPAPQEAEKAPEVSISAAAQKLADENGIDLSTVKGTGAGGNITKSDVEALTNAD